MSNDNKIGKNLKKLRKQKGWSQQELAEKAAEVYNSTLEPLHKKKKFNNVTISQWECGHKTLKMKMIKIMADTLGVTPEDITGGLPEEIKELEISKKIELEDINNYNMRPVYLTSKDNKTPFQWGIVNSELGGIVLGTTAVLDYDVLDKYNIYSAALYGTIHEDMTYRDTLSLKEVMKSNRVWVQLIDYKSYDITHNKTRYNGWYKHNENRTALINNKGCVLSYDNLGDLYNAYEYNPIYSK